jgi:hypothetical protein
MVERVLLRDFRYSASKSTKTRFSHNFPAEHPQLLVDTGCSNISDLKVCESSRACGFAEQKMRSAAQKAIELS